MNSSILCGTVFHKRVEPITNEFTFPVHMYVFDIDEFSRLDASVRLFGYNRHSLVSVRDSDYLKNESGSIKEKITRLLREKEIDGDIKRIRLVTAARYCNYVFNPVSFYYCYTKDDTIACIVAEVTNTFREKHVYVLSSLVPAPEGFSVTCREKKRFHVSPFFERTGEYEFFFTDISEHISICINYYQEGKLKLKTRLEGSCRSLTTQSLTRTVLARPLQAVLTMPRILYEALILYFRKKLPVFRKPEPDSVDTIRGMPPSFFQRIYMRSVFSVFSCIEKGRLTVRLPDGRSINFGNQTDSHDAIMDIHRYTLFKRIFLGSDIGFGEGYMEGDWSSPDLIRVLHVFADNLNRINDHTRRLPDIRKFFDKLKHRNNNNSVSKASHNIKAHYDTSNEFFSFVLDQSLMYSCGIFLSAEDTLNQAQIQKITALCSKAELSPADHVLEIGTGWGAFAVEAVKRTGCSVTTTTISQKQYDYVKQLVEKEGLSDRITLIKEDYRHIEGVFDKIVTIEMIEAVGHEYYREFFSVCDRLLKPKGIMVMQAITIPHERFSEYANNVDWIQKYIFPGGLLPSVEVLKENFEDHTAFRMTDMVSLGKHYARTLLLWRQNLLQNSEHIKDFGFDERTLRMWEYYFAYCEAGFSAGVIDDIHIVMKK